MVQLTRRFIHRAFELGLILKGINGVFETIGGILLLTVNLDTIEHFLIRLSLLELPHGKHDFLAHALFNLAMHFSADTKLTGGIYLLAHGLFKVGLVVGLQLKKHWAYPVGMSFLSIFIAYQIYRLTLHFSFGLFALTLMDMTLMALIYREHLAQVERRLGEI
jgi:uncharacterized membrane protein